MKRQPQLNSDQLQRERRYLAICAHLRPFALSLSKRCVLLQNFDAALIRV
jgi:hypothetical protein